MNTNRNNGLSLSKTSLKKDFNFNLTGADFDIINSEMDENQNYDLKEDEGNDNYGSGSDDYYYREIEEG